MISYPDGTPAQIGDTVALAHQKHIGKVRLIIESDADLASWKLNSPGIMIDTSYVGMAFLPKHLMTPDEIEFISRDVA